MTPHSLLKLYLFAVLFFRRELHAYELIWKVGSVWLLIRHIIASLWSTFHLPPWRRVQESLTRAASRLCAIVYKTLSWFIWKKICFKITCMWLVLLCSKESMWVKSDFPHKSPDYGQNEVKKFWLQLIISWQYQNYKFAITCNLL